MDRRRTAVAIGVSVAFHLLLLAALLEVSHPSAPRPEPAQPPITVAIRELPPPHVQPPPPVHHEPVQPERSAPETKTRKPPAPLEKPTRSAPPARAPAQGERKPEPKPHAPPVGERGPRRVFLVPHDLGLPALEPSWGGHLTRNDGTAPDAGTDWRAENRKAQAKVKGWVSDELATQRVRDGMVDGYFRKVGHALESHAKDPPQGAPHHSLVSRALGGWSHAAAQYGETGAVASGESSNPELRTLDRRLAPPMIPGSNEERIDKGLGGIAVLKRNSRRHPFDLVATVELFQAPDGHLVSIKLKTSSGSRAYDAYVLKAAHAGQLPTPPPKGSGIHPEGIHTLWAFRRQRADHGPQRFICKVRLLGVY